MEKGKTIVYTVITSISGDTKNWQKNVREVRKVLKEQIGNIPNVKILKLDTKEE